jgi:hypothetical protein
VNAVLRLAKVILTLVALLAAAGSARAQETKIARKDVPAAVIAAFEKTYPKATIRGYAKEVEKGQEVYEIESVEGKMTRDINYSADGKALEIEESVEAGELPVAVRQALEQRHPKANIVKAEKLTKGAVVGYELKVKTTDGRKATVTFDANGKEVK